MTVNGIPNVRVCTEPVREGDVVVPQNCWPSLRYDLISLIEKVDFLLPVGFYYKTLYKHRFLWKFAEPFIRRLAGLGSWSKDLGPQAYEHEYIHTDVAVIGGGPAGLAAASAAADAGAEVVLVDDQPSLGGHLRIHHRSFADRGSARPGFEIAREMARGVEGRPNLRVLRGAFAAGGYEGGFLSVVQGDRLFQLRAPQTIVATGTFEHHLLFNHNDLPGIMLGSGALKLLQLYGVRPGKTAIVVTGDDEGLELALELDRGGIRIAAVVDERAQLQDSDAARQLKQLGVPLLISYVPFDAKGKKRIQSLTVVPVGSDSPRVSDARTLPCDLVCLCSRRLPALELFRQNGGKVRYDATARGFVPEGSVAGIQVAGEAAGVRDLARILLQGQFAGLEAANRIHTLETHLQETLKELKAQLLSSQDEVPESCKSEVPASILRTEAKQFVCLCEDVTQKDIGLGVREGFDEIELVKRYTTLSMGPCQGRMCLMQGASCTAAAVGTSLGESGTTTSRPPLFSTLMGVIAGPPHHPVKLTPMHHKHVSMGANQMDMGEWKRPHTYTSSPEEWKRVRECVGLIDVSTLGKISLQGHDAAKLLDKIYTHIFSSLRPGRSRYGVICGDDGIILDDGTVSRLGEDDFYITTTTGNIEFVEKWLKWWIAGTDWCAHVTNVTSDYAAVNLAGPNARNVLRKLTSADVSSSTFKYMHCARAEVGGVPAILLRIGFVGETGWEIHYPACYGEYLWDALLEAGAEFGIGCFGVEAQRILRLEKKHVVVGQDTDALSTPYEADLEWVVKFEKEDFIGKSALLAAKDRGVPNKLVGFIAEGPVQDGSAVVVDRRPVGRVTSARLSPLQNRWIGLALVPSQLSSGESSFDIQTEGRFVKAKVHSQPFYDPEGLRLRE
jgi:sarcosine oxidase subunit alpha